MKSIKNFNYKGLKVVITKNGEAFSAVAYKNGEAFCASFAHLNESIEDKIKSKIDSRIK